MAKRIQRKRTKGWRMPHGTVYVGRPTKWGNPFAVGNVCAETPQRAVDLYAKWLRDDALGREIAHRATRELRGKDLACWCPLGEPCHADVLIEIANG